MAGATTDKLDRVTDSTTSRPVVTTLQSPGKSIGAASITIAAATNWTITSKIHFVIYTTTTIGGIQVKDASSQTDWTGTLSGTTISNLDITGGTDRAYSAGAIVEITPTSAWAKDLYDWATAGHNQDGTHKPFTEANLVATATVIDNAITAAKLSTSAIKLGAATVTAGQNVNNSAVDIVSVTVTVPAGGRDVRIEATIPFMTGSGAGDTASWFQIKEGATILNGKRIRTYQTVDSAVPTVVARVAAPSAGSHTYKLTAVNDSPLTTVAAASATAPGEIVVTAI